MSVRKNMRYILALSWLIAFICLWLLFHAAFDYTDIKNQITLLEKSIESKDWTQAQEYLVQFEKSYEAKRNLVRLNNSTEAFIILEHSIEQLDTTIKNNQESSLEYIGEIKGVLNFVLKPFAGP